MNLKKLVFAALFCTVAACTPTQKSTTVDNNQPSNVPNGPGAANSPYSNATPTPTP